MSSNQNSACNVHRDWIQHLQPVGLVVAPHTLVDLDFVLDRNIGEVRELLRELLVVESVSLANEGRNVVRLPKKHHERFFMGLLGWSHQDLAFLSGAQLAQQSQLSYVVPGYARPLRASYALYQRPVVSVDLDDDFSVSGPGVSSEPSYGELTPRLLAHFVGYSFDDQMGGKEEWDETHHNRFERLLRETGVPLGILLNEECLRVVYAPVGESSGYITFMFEHLGAPSGRHLLSALVMLLQPSILLL